MNAPLVTADQVDRSLQMAQNAVMTWPLNAMERMALCRDLATARLVPPAFQKSPADIFLVMNTIERLKLDFFLTIGECYVIQNKVGFSGKLAAAILNSSGRLAEKLGFSYDGEGDNRTIITSARIQGEASPRTVTIRLGDVKTANKVWTSQPDQQLGYSGARTWGRRHLPEVLLGMQFEDEVQDMIDVTPPPKAPTYPPAGKTYQEALRDDLQRDWKKPTAPAEQAAAERKAKEPPETGPYRIGRDTPDEAGWIAWANKLKAHIEAAREHDIDEWLSLNDGALAELEQFNAAYHERMMSIINDAKAAQAAS